MGKTNSDFQGRTSQLKFWSHILAPKSWLCFQACLTPVFLIPTYILRGDSRLHPFATNHVGASLSSLPAISGSEILTSCFMAFWETHFYSRFIFASSVAPWPPSEDLITGRKKSFLMCCGKGKLNLCFIYVGNEVLNIWQLSYRNVFQLACLWSLLAWGCLRIPWISMERCKENF